MEMLYQDNLKDERIVYGARCVWWDSIDKASKTKDSKFALPCCPHCGSVLFEVPSIEGWMDSVDAHEKKGHPGYRKLVEWCRGRCFRTMGDAVAQYKIETGEEVTI